MVNNMMEELKPGQKVFEGVLVGFEDVKGKKKADNTDFHFLKFNVDFVIPIKDGTTYSKLVELTADPEKFVGRHFTKYQPVLVVMEIVDPIHVPQLINIYQTINA